MKIAANIYVVSALAFLGLVLYLLFAVGAGMGLLILVLAACGQLVLARALFNGKSGASTTAIATSSFIALAFSVLPIYSYVQGGWAEILAIWPLLFPFVAFAIAHSVALVSLLGAKHRAA